MTLTSRCNLQCVHCYADSGPAPKTPDLLTSADYLRLIAEGASLDCRRIQFIGGEPTLHRSLPNFVEAARRDGYEHIEVYTNGTRLKNDLTRCFQDYGVSVAISFYCDDPEIHDAITGHKGSHRASLQTMRELLDAGLTVRASIVAMEQNQARVAETTALLKNLGVIAISVDHARGIGRAKQLTNLGSANIKELCGSCWKQSLCIGPDGVASACIMSRAWPVGNVRTMTLAEIASSAALATMRRRVYDEVWLPSIPDETLSVPLSSNCAPCGPYQPCHPLKGCPPNPCLPNDCAPFAGPCGPVGNRLFDQHG